MRDPQNLFSFLCFFFSPSLFPWNSNPKLVMEFQWRIENLTFASPGGGRWVLDWRRGRSNEMWEEEGGGGRMEVQTNTEWKRKMRCTVHEIYMKYELEKWNRNRSKITGVKNPPPPSAPLPFLPPLSLPYLEPLATLSSPLSHHFPCRNSNPNLIFLKLPPTPWGLGWEETKWCTT